ncbi:hypothetical protein ACL2XN_02680 [Sodalis sp. RH22]|uniref:hypothetical protein n=1 Tax=Sodalis sp. RH22 TaxID=3394337 RepID=UPI0039B51A43
MSVFLRTSPCAVSEELYVYQTSGRLMVPSNDTRDIIRIAVEELGQAGKPHLHRPHQFPFNTLASPLGDSGLIVLWDP